MSIKSIVKINEGVGIETRPQGWVVRELFDSKKNRSIIFELGIYINENTFLGVPLHYSFKKDLIPIAKKADNDNYNYYLVGENVEVGLSTFKNKKGKVIPVLVPPSEKTPAIKVACIALAATEPEKVIYANIPREDNIVVRDYIDKDRNCIVAVIACNDTTIINPSIELNVDTGVIASKCLTKKTYSITLSPVMNTDTELTKDAVKTKFIKFDRFIKKPERVSVKKEEKTE